MTERPLKMSSNEPGWGRSGADSGHQGSGNAGESGGSDSGPRGPVNSGPGGGNGGGSPRPPRPPDGPPDLDELWRDLSRKLNGLFGGGRGGQGGGGGGPRGPNLSGRAVSAGIGVVAGVAALLWLASGVYIVPEGQQAAVLRFGEFRYITPRPGLQWRMPWPIEKEEIVDVSLLRPLEIGFRAGNVRNRVNKESLVLTGDRNIVDLQVALQYRISDVEAYLFQNNLSPSPDDRLREIVESAVREVAGRKGIDQILYSEKEATAREAQELTQALLDRYHLGIQISSLTFQQAQPPEQVQAAFEDAIKAEQDRYRQISEGQAYANDVVPRARGTADRLRLEAQGYRDRIISTAEGDSARFVSVLEEYSRAPAVTRERMYLETMQQIFTNTSKVLVDSRSGSNLMYLPIDKLLQQTGAAPARSPDPSRTQVRPDPAPSAAPPPAPANPPRDMSLRSRDR